MHDDEKGVMSATSKIVSLIVQFFAIGAFIITIALVVDRHTVCSFYNIPDTYSSLDPMSVVPLVVFVLPAIIIGVASSQFSESIMKEEYTTKYVIKKSFFSFKTMISKLLQSEKEVNNKSEQECNPSVKDEEASQVDSEDSTKDEAGQERNTGLVEEESIQADGEGCTKDANSQDHNADMRDEESKQMESEDYSENETNQEQNNEGHNVEGNNAQDTIKRIEENYYYKYKLTDKITMSLLDLRYVILMAFIISAISREFIRFQASRESVELVYLIPFIIVIAILYIVLIFDLFLFLYHIREEFYQKTQNVNDANGNEDNHEIYAYSRKKQVHALRIRLIAFIASFIFILSSSISIYETISLQLKRTYGIVEIETEQGSRLYAVVLHLDQYYVLEPIEENGDKITINTGSYMYTERGGIEVVQKEYKKKAVN